MAFLNEQGVARLWQNIVAKLGTKANADHNHDDAYETKGAAAAVKDELLNGAGEAYDTLKELGDLINENVDAIEALELVASTKSDWNQNDETANDYIKNRPFYDFYIDTVVAEQQTINVDAAGPFPFTSNELFVAGNEYIVYFNNMEYKCIATTSDAVLQHDDLPFILANIDGNTAILAYDYGSYTISVFKRSYDIKKIDPKYLPIENIQSDWAENDENSLSYIKNRPGGYKTIGAVCSAVFTADDDNTLSGVLPEGFDDWLSNNEIRRVRIKENGIIRTVKGGGIGTGGYIPILDAEDGHRYGGARLYDGESITILPKDEYHYNSGSSYTLEFLGDIYHKFDINYLDERVYSELNPPPQAPQADWNESDSSSLSYIQNRPFYEEFSRTPIMYNTGVDVSDPMDGGLFQLNEPLVIGNLYGVCINDDIYECVAYRPDPMSPMTVLGNGYMFGSDMYGDMPFSLATPDEVPTDCILFPQSAGHYSMMITLITSHVKQIDEKYLPTESIQSDWAENDETSLSYIKNRPGGYVKQTLIGSVIVEAVEENNLQLTLDANNEDHVALFNHLYPNKLSIMHLASIRETGTNRKFYWYYGSGIYWSFFDENRDYIAASKYVVDSKGNMADGSVLNFMTINSYEVGKHYTIDIYDISTIEKIPREYVEPAYYVQDTEPTDAEDGAIWIDTANDPAFIAPNLPAVTEADNGKILMVVNGTWQAVNLNLSVDADGVVSI